MATYGPNPPGTAVDDATIGTVSWATPTNATTSDSIYATATLPNPGADNEIKLVSSAGTILSTNRSTSTGLPVSPAFASYGGTADLWGATWTASDINNANFGVAFSVIDGSTSTISHYLKITNFGFSVPTGATINGILVEILRRTTVGGAAGVDFTRITVTATPIHANEPGNIGRYVQVNDGMSRSEVAN